jgi:hypothetical protein
MCLASGNSDSTQPAEQQQLAAFPRGYGLTISRNGQTVVSRSGNGSTVVAAAANAAAAQRRQQALTINRGVQ